MELELELGRHRCMMELVMGLAQLGWRMAMELERQRCMVMERRWRMEPQR